MSTYRSTFNKRKGIRLIGWMRRWTTCCVLWSLIALLSIQFVLFLSPIASATQTIASNSPEDIARAGVSVVRLIVSYGPTPPGAQALSSARDNTAAANTSLMASSTPRSAQCTGLGVLVASWSSPSKDEQNAWVLTDGSLVNRDGFTCATPALPSMTLASVRVLMSNAYSTAPQQGFSGKVDTVQCSQRPCSNGVSLFSFHSDVPLPFINIASSSTNTPPYSGITLSTSSSSLAAPSIGNAPQYLTPSRIALNEGGIPTAESLAGREGGTPLVNKNGYLTSMYVGDNPHPTLRPIDEINTMFNRQNIAENTTMHQNVVHDNWDSGINEYVQGPGHYSKARGYFNQAFNASNQLFLGAQTYASLATQQPGTENKGPSSPGNTSSDITLPYIGFVPYSILGVGVVGLLLLIVFLILFSKLFKRGQRLREEFAQADREATFQTHTIQEMEAAQGQHLPQTPQSQQPPVWAQQTIPQEMSPVAPYQTQQQMHAMPVAPLASMSAASSGLPMQLKAIADVPTIDMTQEAQRNEQMDKDRTVPFTQHPLQPMNGGHLGFEIITSTDPGLKRKHKPNEDSLFAIEGVRNANGSLQQIGLFIVADGMGGHANGQDASRLAIQTIIDYVLPRLLQQSDASQPAQLLVDSVQGANQAVHQHNMDNRADMGTTVTATLVIDSTAYVANVGDSRTYLYRVSDGLSKVTKDHSVVASLVDAGIIKPDDIYTHPKRNQIYRSLGEKPFVEVDPFIIQLQPGDKLLLCSDGLWDMVRDPQIEQVLKTPTTDPKQVGDNLIQAALEGGGEDNVSVIVVNVIGTAQRNLRPGLKPIYVQENIHLPEFS